MTEPIALAELIETKNIGHDASAAWEGLRATILSLARAIGAKNILEIGGGRHPFLMPSELIDLGANMTINDISETELALAPESFPKTCFDISSDLPKTVTRSGYDFIFSRMVLEHVRDARKAWANMSSLLTPGGVSFAFIPTLYALPFVINYLLPEIISREIVQKLDPDRTEDGIPKFPAYYRLCRARQKVIEPELLRAGFREVSVVPFFGTPYFPEVAILRHVMRAFDRLVESLDARQFCSYAYIIARK